MLSSPDQQQHQIPAIHSMTSSARASIESGILTPISRATLRLRTSSNLVGCWAGVSPGGIPFSIFVDQRRLHSSALAQRRAVARQTAGSGHFSPLADRRKLVLKEQRAELVAV